MFNFMYAHGFLCMSACVLKEVGDAIPLGLELGAVDPSNMGARYHTHALDH